MAGLTNEQRQNLQQDGYTIREQGSKTYVEREDSFGNLTRQTIGSDGTVSRTDMYEGNVRDHYDHDRLTVNHGEDTPLYYHGRRDK